MNTSDLLLAERTPHKPCSNCFQVKPLAEFYKKLSGFQSRCKACNAEVVRGYYARSGGAYAARARARRAASEISGFAK